MSAKSSCGCPRRSSVVRCLAVMTVAVLATACATPGGKDLGDAPGAARFDAATWDDGLAVVTVFRGRVKRYGSWRDAEARDYLVREYLEPTELTKRDQPTAELIPVMKANRLVQFETGAYGYRLMSTLSFRRADTLLVRGRGSCQNACGLVTHAWDVNSGRVDADSYWEHEGQTGAALPAAADRRFADELPFVANTLTHGSVIRVVAPLASPRSIVRTVDEVSADTGLGIGDICEECLAPGSGASASRGWAPGGQGFGALPPHVRAQSLTVQRQERVGSGATVQLLDGTSSVVAEFHYDDAGHLERWTIRGEQEFERVRVFRGAYWELIADADQARVRAR